MGLFAFGQFEGVVLEMLLVVLYRSLFRRGTI